ncbi:uncharacterized protein DS421_11g337360 [Arachis hypogaea]|nr:uncharacterized protein DS421_11g337360 [Arachis hypogaea]
MQKSKIRKGQNKKKTSERERLLQWHWHHPPMSHSRVTEWRRHQPNPTRSNSHSHPLLALSFHYPPHESCQLTSHQNDVVFTRTATNLLLRARNAFYVGGCVARGEVAYVRVVVKITVLPLVEVEGVAEWVVLVVCGDALGCAVVVAIEGPANEGLPSRTGEELRPLAELLECPEAAGPPVVGGGGRRGAGGGVVGPGGCTDALPP